MPGDCGLAGSPPCLRSRLAKRWVRILSCNQRRWSGRALGPGSMSSLTVTQISRSFDAKRQDVQSRERTAVLQLCQLLPR
jgi:hypothetical protein